jgi:hypothetical protein
MEEKKIIMEEQFKKIDGTIYMFNDEPICDKDMFVSLKDGGVRIAETFQNTVGYYNRDRSGFLWIQDYHKKLIACDDEGLVNVRQLTESEHRHYLRSLLKEKILCAAIWFDDGKKYNHQPKNIESGLVLCGHRHGCIFQQIGGLVAERQQLGIYEKEQGYLTNTNRFVDRVEALEIAKRENQLLDPKATLTQLYSEDLY